MLIKKEYIEKDIIWRRKRSEEHPRCSYGGCSLYKDKCGGFISDYTELCTRLNMLFNYSYVPIKI